MAKPLGFVIFAAAFLCRAGAFPVYYNINGSVMLTSTLGGNLTLRPDGGGAIVAASVIAAQGGVALNNTLLTEQLIARLQPPVCSSQGTDMSRGYPTMYYTPDGWQCVCIGGWTGADCGTLPPPPPSPPPSPPALTLFTAVGAATFTATTAGFATILVVAGGGAGGAFAGGGGGGGGVQVFRNVSLTPGTFTVVVGAGGQPVSGCGGASTMYHAVVAADAGRGGDSSFGNFPASLGGGRGACGGNRGDASATSCGSGGGGGSSDPGYYPNILLGGTGTPGKGYPGGNAVYGSNSVGSAGGGGANQAGGDSFLNQTAGNGGDGLFVYFPGIQEYFGGGGGGAIVVADGSGGLGGLGGGGAGATYSNGGGTVTGGAAGLPNSGGGGGGGGVVCCSGVGSGFPGGSGIVVVAWLS